MPRREEYVLSCPQLAPQLRDQFEVHQALAYDPLWEDEVTLRAGAPASPVMGAPPARAEERGAQSAKREAPSAEHSAPGAPRSASLSRGTHIRCPHSHNPIHLCDTPPDEVPSPACCSSFHVRETRQTTPTPPMRHLANFHLLRS